MYQVLIKDGPKGDELEIHSPFSNALKLDKGSIKKSLIRLIALIYLFYQITQLLEKLNR